MTGPNPPTVEMLTDALEDIAAGKARVLTHYQVPFYWRSHDDDFAAAYDYAQACSRLARNQAGDSEVEAHRQKLLIAMRRRFGLFRSRQALLRVM